MTTKQLALDAIQRLPEDATWQDLTEEIAFLAALREGEEDMTAGRVVTHEEVGRRLETWIAG